MCVRLGAQLRWAWILPSLYSRKRNLTLEDRNACARFKSKVRLKTRFYSTDGSPTTHAANVNVFISGATSNQVFVDALDDAPVHARRALFSTLIVSLGEESLAIMSSLLLQRAVSLSSGVSVSVGSEEKTALVEFVHQTVHCSGAQAQVREKGQESRLSNLPHLSHHSSTSYLHLICPGLHPSFGKVWLLQRVRVPLFSLLSV